MTAPLVLIIEDDIDLADIFSATLERAGFTTKNFYDGESALFNLPRMKPDLIILDLNLPKYSGANLFTFIRNDERLRDTWVIIATADATQASALESLELENTRLLTLIKPVGVSQLRELAQRLIFDSRKLESENKEG